MWYGKQLNGWEYDIYLAALSEKIRHIGYFFVKDVN
jgi:hypothetical protein